ncbi:PHA/PHB synthase family protein [Actinomycetospora sp. CA-101289]|uniref:PHA/PHB synthase family protein n=1 Tax=Actinomycetospora sp. CA-101289 TaxID=3239893 RepID=UPI003D96216D
MVGCTLRVSPGPRRSAITTTTERTDGSGAPRSGQRTTTDAITRDIVRGDGPTHPPGLTPAKAALALLSHPGSVARHGLRWAGELGQIVAGRSEVEAGGDKRFKDPAWRHNPALHRLLQAYVATGRTIDELIDDADLDRRTQERLRFVAGNVLEALSPSNFPLTNPTVLKAAVDSGGTHFLRGLRNLVGDLRSGSLLPSTVDASRFTVGEDLATTPGAVVARTEVFELIQYDPQTEQVREAPLLLVPQMINKYYIADLAPGKSLLEYAVARGQQVFAISWRNPDGRHADWDLDTYADAVLTALDAVEDVTGSSSTQLMGLCAGGTLSAMVLGHLAATGRQDRIAGLVLSVTVLDWAEAGTHGAFLDRFTAAAAMAESSRKGYLDGGGLAAMFSFLRPTDMIWNFWINNYLLGQDPPAWDVLYWNQDQTNMPAALHRDFVQMGLENPLTRPGAITVLGTPIDLSAVTVDSYLVGAVDDHIAPWRNVYATTRLLGAEPRFVLSTSGHVVATVNPPEESSASFETRDNNPADPDDWRAGATTTEGSWWPHWAAWLGERSGAWRPAPSSPGSAAHPVLGKAPGEYVRETT